MRDFIIKLKQKHKNSSTVRRILLWLTVICLALSCTVYERTEFQKLSYESFSGISFLSSENKDLCYAVTNEIRGLTVIRGLIARSRGALRRAWERAGSFDLAIDNCISLFICAFVFFCLHYRKFEITSHYFILSYIQDLDGMKP